jgi:hypothetical protein
MGVVGGAVERVDTPEQVALTGELVRGEERVGMRDIDLVTRGGIVVFRNTVARIEPRGMPSAGTAMWMPTS